MVLRTFSYDNNDIQRFWAKVRKTDECWEWAGKPNEKGYGRFGVRWNVILAHRFAWVVTHGEIPNNLSVLHRCDNPICVRPDHLFLGTVADNNADMRAKGRGFVPHVVSRTTFSKEFFAINGHPRAKLTKKQVLEIRDLQNAGLKLREIAKRYGISIAQASKVVRGEAWGS